MTRATIDAKLRLIVAGERALGPGKVDLLEHIARLGSISAAAKAMNMSYSRAWSLVDTMNRAFKRPVVESATGGKRGGGARVTAFGAQIVAHYREMQAAVAPALADYLAEFQRLLK